MEILVMMDTAGVKILVASKRPPMPVSIMAHVHTLTPEFVERHRRGEFKKGRLSAQSLNPLDRFIGSDNLVVANGGVINGNPFIETLQMGRGIASDLEAGFKEDGGEHGCHRAFAIGAGDVDGGKAVLRMAQSLQEYPDNIKPQLDAKTLEFEHLSQTVGISKRRQ